MKLVIIAGGKGTRLGLSDIPKPMCELNGIPLLEHQINLAKRYGIKDIIIISGFLSHVITDYFKEGSELGVKITHIVEQEALGTAGCFNLIRELVNERFLVFYGDIAMDFDIKCFIDFDKQFDSIGTLLVHPNDHPYDSDLVEVKNNYITHFHSKPLNSNKYYANLVNAAVYIFSSEIFKYIVQGEKQDFGKDIFPRIIKANERLSAYNTHEYIRDMGTIDRRNKVQKDIQSGKVARLNKTNKQKAIFIDRDGVINKDVDNLANIDDFELLDGVSEALEIINKSDYLAILITNQPVIAKGFISDEGLNEIHKKMQTQLGQKRVYFDAIYYCPHHPETGWEDEIKELKIDCECRKPKPGMLIKAAKEFNINLNHSWMIGDSEVDILAGKSAGCKTIFVGNKKGKIKPDIMSNSLISAIKCLL